MLKGILLFSFLCCTFIESSEFKGNEESKFLVALEKELTAFLPYNPKILQLGGQEGAATKWLAAQFPKGNLIVFESNEEKFIQLKTNLHEFKNTLIYNLSLKPTAESNLSLDEWCEQNKISSLDLIRLDSEGADWSILKASPKILKTASVISIKLIGSSNKNGITIKKNLERLGFNLLPSQHQEKMGNELVFIRKDIYDCIFK